MNDNVFCSRCRGALERGHRVIFSAHSTFVFKPASVQDTVNPAKVSPDELAESRKDHLRTAIVNTFGDWGKMEVPEDAFNFRHQWCEPMRTGAVGSLHAVNKHAIRFARSMPGRLHG